MIILGICFLSDASACILKDGKIIAAVSEERLNRKKLWFGIPKLAIKEVMKLANIKEDQIDFIATHGVKSVIENEDVFREKVKKINESRLDKPKKLFQLEELKIRLEHEKFVINTRTPKYISEIKKLFPKISVQIYDHHECHAATAYFGSNFNKAYTLTADGWGEDGSASLWYCEDNKMTKVSTTPSIDSLGYFYGSITKYLNFVPHRHEGKVLGLAAYVNKPKSYDIIKNMIGFDKIRLQFLGLYDKGIYLPKYDNKNLNILDDRFSREDIASSAQKVLEETVCALVTEIKTHKKINKFDLCIAGGVFANVKLNQKLSELNEVNNLYVFPNMGDGGLCVGAAWLTFIQQKKSRPNPIIDMRIGTNIENLKETFNKFKKHNLTLIKCNHINKEIAILLEKGFPVIRVSGPMEFGPRALGNRSILCNASDPDINESLNKKLKRSEFMPFAPITLIEDFEKLYKNNNSTILNLPYMTSTLEVKEKMIQESPTTVHIDDTARPQIIDKKLYPDLHEILCEYKNLTGKSSLINTSFNMHEEPIVCDVNDAMKAFISSNLPYIAINNYLIKNNEISK